MAEMLLRSSKKGINKNIMSINQKWNLGQNGGLGKIVDFSISGLKVPKWQ